MGWDYASSLERAQTRWEQTSEITITDVKQKIDFDQISRLHPRRVVGSHFYVDVANFNKVLRSGHVDDDEMVRLLHVFAREASQITESDFDGQKVHFQGPRLHALSYRPIGDESAIAAKAVLTSLAIRHLVALFNEQFALAEDVAWVVAAGIDHGTTLATRNGAGGDQELLFLGNAANRAAHVLSKVGVRMTAAVRELLPESFDPYLSEVSSDEYRVSMSASTVESMANSFGWPWTLATSKDRLADLADKYKAGCVKVSDVKENIDKSTVSLSNTKRAFGISLFADVDGFTDYIEGLTTSDEDPVEGVRVFHTLRGELRDSVVQDFDGLRIQYQGDRIQAFAYRPVGDNEAIALKAVQLASALITLAEEVVPEATSVTEPPLPVAIGLAAGEVLVAKVGQHGSPDLMSIGGSTATAATIEGRLKGGEIGLDSELYSLLPDWLQAVFTWSGSAKAYVAKDLNFDEFGTLLESASADESASALGKAALLAAGGLAAAGVGAAAYLKTRDRMPTTSARPWSRD
jgi:class 3 adenylate cyclase